MPSTRRSRLLRAFAAAALTLTLVGAAVSDAEARAGRGGSFGSRGLRTWQAPAPTRTAPAPAPLERSATPATRPGATQAMPGQAAPASRGLFGGGFGRGLLGGLIGAGLIGMLLGGGFFGGLGSLAGLLGFALQVLLIVFLARMVFRFFQNRTQPAHATAGAGGPQGGNARMAGMGAPGAGPWNGDPLVIEGADFDAFERLLGEIQTAYSAEDLATLRRLATPEMAAEFADELADNASRGVVNRIAGVRLLQGDLSEAWREGATDYATVAMRYALTDALVNRETGAVVEGDPDRPTEATEMWTFRRAAGGGWVLSAIQQQGGGR